MDELEGQVCAWTDQVRRFLLRRVGGRGLAADLANEAAARLIQELRGGRRPADPRAWLFRTARNLAVDEVRRRLPSPLGLEALATMPDPAAVAAAEPAWVLGEDEWSRSELLLHLPRALDRLPAHYRRLLEAHYREGLDCASVAERERISVANAKVRLHRARRQLGELLRGAVSR